METGVSRSSFSLRSLQFSSLCVWADPGLGPLGGGQTEAFSRGLSPQGPSVIPEAGIQMFGVHRAGPSCGPGCGRTLWLTSWPRGPLLVTGFSLRSGVGWGNTCAGVRNCRNLLDPSPGAGAVPQTRAPRPQLPAHVGVILELSSLGQAGGHSWLAM